MMIFFITSFYADYTQADNSVNRINYGVSFQFIGKSHIVTSNYIYDFIMHLPDEVLHYENERLVRCSVNISVLDPISTTRGGPIENGIMGCSDAFRSLIQIYRETSKAIHEEIFAVVREINAEIPQKLVGKNKNRKIRAWFNIIGNLAKKIFGTLDSADGINIYNRLAALETYAKETNNFEKIEINKLVSGERIIQKDLNTKILEIKNNLQALTKGIQTRTDALSMHTEWNSILLAKTMQVLHHGNIVMRELTNLLHAIKELKQGILSTDLVSNNQMQRMITYINLKMQTNDSTMMYLIPQTHDEVRQYAQIHASRENNTLIISLILPLSHDPTEFLFYKIIKHAIAMPNSEVHTILNTDVKFIGIEPTTLKYVIVSETDMWLLKTKKYHLVRANLFFTDFANNCILSIYQEDRVLIKKNCQYDVINKVLKPQITQYMEESYYLQNIENYNISCKSETSENTIGKICEHNCLIELSSAHIQTNPLNSVDASQTCVLTTDFCQLFYQPFAHIQNNRRDKPQYPINLAVLSRLYESEQIEHLNAQTSIDTLPRFDFPKFELKFFAEDYDQTINLDKILNATGEENKIYASIFRDPNYLSSFLPVDTTMDIVNIVALIVACVSFLGVLYAWFTMRSLSLKIMLLQSAFMHKAEALPYLELTQKPTTTVDPGLTLHEQIIQISNDTWIYIFVLLLIVSALKCLLETIWRKCTTGLLNDEFETGLILNISNGTDSIYIKTQSIFGLARDVTIDSEMFLSSIDVTGIFNPRLIHNWQAIINNNATGISTPILQKLEISFKEAFIIKRIIKKKYSVNLLVICTREFEIIQRLNRSDMCNNGLAQIIPAKAVFIPLIRTTE